MLRDVDETLALLALLWMLMQATLAVVIELSSFTALLLFEEKAYLTAFQPDQYVRGIVREPAVELCTRFQEGVRSFPFHRVLARDGPAMST